MANNSTSPAHGQHLSESETWSRCVTGTVTATHPFEVTNFSLLEGMGIGKYVESSTFSAGNGRDWSIVVCPGWKEEDKAVYVSVYLNFKSGPVGVRVKFSLSLPNKHGFVSKVREETYTFERHRFRGWGQYMEKSMLQPFLLQNNDCFTIRCDLAVIQPHRTEAAASTILFPPSNLQQHFESMLKDGRGTDHVTFSVAGEIFRAHRCVLAARSPVFQAELFGPVKDNATKPIRIDDMEPAIFEALLHFIYTDAISDNASGNVAMQHLLVAADRYGLDRLKAICEDKLWHAIDVETVATTLTLAEQHHCVQLKDGCIRFIIASRDVLGDVMNTEGFKHLVASCPLLMKEILDKMAGVIRNDKVVVSAESS